MEDRKLEAAESLELIGRMIENTRSRIVRNSGRPLLAWGYATVVTTIIVWAAVVGFRDPRWNYLWLLLPLLGTFGRPRSYQRFLIQARACLGHDARGGLGRIGCPALVVGGGRDQVVGAEAAGVLAEHLSQSRLWIYPELGHGLYEEAADLPARVLAFLSQ